MLYRNKKNGKTYIVMAEAINCTNAQDGQKMYIYKAQDCPLTFVRSQEEFHEKFEEIK